MIRVIIIHFLKALTKFEILRYIFIKQECFFLSEVLVKWLLSTLFELWISSSVEPEASVTFKATWSRAEVGQCFSEKDQVKSIVHSGGCMISRPVTHLCQQQHAQKQP